jgi:NADPH:quinone reductase-like Zn-dependent oxidoreductase
MLFEHAHVAPGQRVLVLGAAGNVGAYAVQLARLVRAQVIATAGTSDVDYVRELGADEVIDYRVSRLDENLDAVDAVIDTVGGDLQARSFAVVRPGGMVVSSVSQPDTREAERTEVRTAYFLVTVTSPCLAKLASMFDAGELEASVGSVLQLAQARTAHEMLDGMRSRPRGKIVLQTSN